MMIAIDHFSWSCGKEFLILSYITRVANIETSYVNTAESRETN